MCGGGTHQGNNAKSNFNEHKHWTAEDEEYLREHWGCKGGKISIAKVLGRSVEAIQNRANRLHLGPFINGGEDVSFDQLFMIVNGIGRNGGYAWTLKRWQQWGLHIKRVRVNQNTFRMISITEFWKWAKKNQDKLDFSRFTENALGCEPKWVKQKRAIDRKNRSIRNWKKIPWSEQEDALLAFMCKSGMFSWNDLCNELKRSSQSIRRRIYDLYLPSPRKSQIVKWTEADMRQLVNLIDNGYSNDYCAITMQRSAQAVRGKLEWIKKKGLWEEYGGRPL